MQTISIVLGPAPLSTSSGNILSRPHFPLDLKTVSGTDSKGPQDEYDNAVEESSSFHRLLDDSNSNKLEKKLCCSILKSQCYGRGKDLLKSVPKAKFNSADSASHFLKAIHKRDPLSFFTDIYSDFNKLLKTCSGNNESMKNFDTFEAQLSR